MSDEAKPDLSREQMALVCMIVSNPGGGERQHAWQKRVNDFIRAQQAEIERLKNIEPDWWWRDLDPDDSGDTPHEALRNVRDYVVCHLRSSHTGIDKFAVRVPTLDPDNDDDEVLMFDTEQEALAASRERLAAIKTRLE
jgi:hypothetical protein